MMAAGAALVAGCSTSHHSAAASTSTSAPAATTSTEPPPQYAPSPYSWQRAGSPTLAIGGGPSATLASVLAPQLTGSWLVFGSRTGTSGAPAATEWSSQDAIHWTATPLGAEGSPSQATAAAQYRTTTVVVGSTGEGGGQQAAVWRSPGPGVPFVREPVPPSNGPSTMTLVAAGALGMFATGTVDGRFAMWSSTNGRQWSELPVAEKVIGSSAGARVNALVADGDFVYAAGSIQFGPDLQAALWSTSDGLNWHLVGSANTSFSGPGGRVIYSLAPLGTGLVAVGAIDQGSGWLPASWISPDGQSWSLPSVDFPAVAHPPATTAPLGDSGGSAVRSVSAVPSLAGATTVVAAGGGPYGQQAWTSKDGLHWTSLSLPSADSAATSWRAELVAGTGSRTVVVDAEPGQPYLLTDQSQTQSVASSPGASVPSSLPGTWNEPSDNPAVFGPVRTDAVPVSLQLLGGRLQLVVELVHRPQVIGPASVTTAVLSSADGTVWSALPGGSIPAGSPPSRPAANALAAHLPSGWVAVSSQPSPRPQVWTSPAGAAWKAAAGLPVTAAGGTSPPSSTPAIPGVVTVNGICTARLPAGTASPSGSGGSSGSSGSSGSGGSGGSTAASTPRYLIESVGALATISAPVQSSGSLPAVTLTRSAVAWSSPTGAVWRGAPVGSAPPAGGTTSLSGCLAVGSGLVAFGSGTATSGVPQPALWRSTDGASWTREAVSAFGSGPTTPIISLAAGGQNWLAASNPDPLADPLQPGAPGERGPAATAGEDAGVGPSPSIENGRDALWLSTDSGTAWQLIDTATAPWLGGELSQIDLVGFTSAAAGHSVPVVVGVMDGQLAVWVGSPTSQAAGGD